MSETNPTSNNFRALVPAMELTLWEDESTYTENSPRVGSARVSKDTTSAGRLITSGTQSEKGHLVVQVDRSGYPGPNGATYVWKNNGDTLFRGWDSPTAISGWESVVWTDGSSGGLATYNPHAITLANGKVIIAYGFLVTSPATAYGVRTQTRAASGATTASAVTVYSQSANLARGFHPCLLELPSGRVLLFHGLEPTASTYQMRVWYSDDDGATWEVYSEYALLDSTYFTISTAVRDPGRIRASYLNGQILLFLQTRDADLNQGSAVSIDQLWQWASSDLGVTFTPIQDQLTGLSGATGIGGTLPCLSVVNGGFLLGWAMWDTGDNLYSPAFLKIADAYSDFTAIASSAVQEFSPVAVGAVSTPGTSYQSDSGDLAMAVDDAGAVWVTSLDGETGAPDFDGYTLISVDGGGSFTQTTDGVFQNKWWISGDPNTKPARYSSFFWRSCHMLVSQWDANPGNEDNSVSLIRMGGPTTVTLPLLSFSLLPSRREDYGTNTWLPMDLPGDSSWAKSGTGTESLASGALLLTSSSNSVYYTDTTTTSAGRVRAHLQVDSGGSLASDDVAILLDYDNGSSFGYSVSIRFTTTGFRAYDNVAAAAIGSDVTVDTTGGIEVIAQIISDELFIAYRVSDNLSDQAFTKSHDGESISDSGGSSVQYFTRWGNIASATATSQWTLFEFAASGKSLSNLANPGDLWGTPLSSTGGYVNDGVSIRGEIGPFVLGDQWEIEAIPDWPIEDMLTYNNPSTRRHWRSASATPTAAETHSYQIVEGYETAGLQEESMALILQECNWRTATLYRDTGSGTWTSLASIDLATGLTSIPYTRKGNTVYLNPGSYTAPFYMHRNTLAGATVDLGSSKYRTVLSNSDGSLTTTATTRTPRLVLDGVDDTEPTSGNMSIWMPGGAIIIHMSGTVPEAAGYRLVIDAHTTPAGYVKGKAHIGPLVVFPIHPDAGRVRGRRSSYSEQQFSDGTVRRYKDGPGGRFVGIRWTDNGVPTIGVGGEDPVPHYVTGTSAGSPRALAAVGASPDTFLGLIEDTVQSSKPVGYIGYVPRGSSSTSVHHIMRPDLFMVGYMTGTVRTEDRVPNTFTSGNSPEWSGSVTTVATLTIEETP